MHRTKLMHLVAVVVCLICFGACTSTTFTIKEKPDNSTRNDSIGVQSFVLPTDFSPSVVADAECPPGTRLQRTKPLITQVIKGIGYGVAPANDFPPAQRRVLALRAAKLDAYRDLAEKISGLRISSDATVSNLAMQNDKLRVFVEATVKNARLVSQNLSNDGVYEVTLETVIRDETISSADQSDKSCVSAETQTAPKARTKRPKAENIRV